MRVLWTRDEVILGLDLLFSSNPNELTIDSPLIIGLSELLRRLPIISTTEREKYFRNPAGVRRQLLTFMWSIKKNKKASHVGKQFYIVYNEYKNKLDELYKIAKAIRRCEKIASLIMFGDPTESYGFPEGAILSHVHRYIETSYAKRCKEVLEECTICGLRPNSVYISIDRGMILAKHLLVEPTELDPEVNYSEDDFITVCSNCHQALHIIRPWRTRNDYEGIII